MSDPFSSDLSPAYNVDVIDMTNAAGQTPQGYAYNLEHGFIQVTFRDANRAPLSNVSCEVSFGQSQNDKIPLDYNGRIFLGDRASRVAKFFFANTAGAFIYVVTSPNPTMLNIDVPNPLQSFTQTVGTTIETTNHTIGTTAAIISASNSTTVSRIVQNNHASNDLYIGGASTVTTANGLKVPAGGSLVIDKSFGEIWGIANAASTDVRLFRERV